MKALALALIALVSLHARAETFEFRFWPPNASFSDPRISAIHEGPCGPVATARVERMPLYSKKEPLAPERVLELSPQGNVLNLWRVPVDAQVLGIAGQQLFFQFDTATFGVDADGTIARAPERSYTAPKEVATCGAARHFDGSAYAACWRYRDAISGKSRLLAYEGPCT